MTTERDDMTDLDALFDAAKSETLHPSEALMAKVLSDARAVQDAAGVPPIDARGTQRQGWLRQWLDGIGGWPAMGGLSTAALVGLWLGISPPVQFQQMTALMLDDRAVEATELWIDSEAVLAFGLGEELM